MNRTLLGIVAADAIHDDALGADDIEAALRLRRCENEPLRSDNAGLADENRALRERANAKAKRGGGGRAGGGCGDATHDPQVGQAQSSWRIRCR